jgi:hypothetical protein
VPQSATKWSMLHTLRQLSASHAASHADHVPPSSTLFYLPLAPSPIPLIQHMQVLRQSRIFGSGLLALLLARKPGECAGRERAVAKHLLPMTPHVLCSQSTDPPPPRPQCTHLDHAQLAKASCPCSLPPPATANVCVSACEQLGFGAPCTLNPINQPLTPKPHHK